MVFTKAQLDNMVGTYVAVVGADYAERTKVVKELAAELGVTTNVIIGKLVAEKVYVKKEAASAAKAGTRVDKEALALSFEAAFGIKIKSIRNMTGKDLAAFWERFVEMSDIRDAE